MAHVPRWYVSAYLLIKLPLVMLAGLAFALLFTLSPRLSRPVLPPRARREIAIVAFTIVFPVLAHAITQGPAFTGLRHFMFVVPPFAVLAGIGCDVLMRRLRPRHPLASNGIAAVIAAMMLWNAINLLRLHPYEYLYYNSIVGGLQGAAGRYETDYWSNIMPEAVHQLAAYLARTERQSGPPEPYYVTACAQHEQFEQATNARLLWMEDGKRADFFISTTHMDCDRRLPGKVIVRIERLGALIGVVKDRRAITRPDLAQGGH